VTTRTVDPRAAAMTEAEFEKHVGQIAADHGVWRHHNPDSRAVAAGLPDDLFVGSGGALWAELKTEAGRLSPAQAMLMALLRAAGHRVVIWRPSDLLSGLVEREIRAISGRKVAVF
jgi:hypothetical protein